MAQRSAIVNVMVKAAQKAGRSLARDFGEVEHLQVSKKGPGDFVSKADKRAEQLIIEELQKGRPDWTIIAEESGVTKGTDEDNCFIIDPLDGTTNFLHGIPHFAISLAYQKEGKLVAGVVYDPIKDEIFWAEQGAGAWLESQRAKTRLRVAVRRDLEESVMATGIPHIGRPAQRPFLAELFSVMTRCAGVRRMGSAALDLAYVAAGRFDGYWETSLQTWDIAAGIVLVREAGGYVTRKDGRTNPEDGKSILATNPDLHLAMLQVLKAASKTSEAAAARAAEKK